MTFTDTERTAGTTYYYRVLAEHNKRFGTDTSGDATDAIRVYLPQRRMRYQ